MVRRVLRRARTRVEQWRHPGLRQAALDRLHELPLSSRTLFVCLGNICRSPYAAAVLVQRLGVEGAAADSAGFIGPGRESPIEAREEAALRGIDLRAHRSRLVVPADADRFDLFVVMEPGQVRRLQGIAPVPAGRILVLGDLDPELPERRMILDPFGRGPAAFAAAYERIDRTVELLVASLQADPEGRREP